MMTTATDLARPAQAPLDSAGRLGHLVGALGDGPDLPAHLGAYGPIPEMARGALAGLAEQAGLTGRGGAAFPTARKLATVGARRGAVVVGNASEGEPASLKDKALLRARPNLVLDGLQLAAAEVDARRVVLYLHRDAQLQSELGVLLAERQRTGVDGWPVEIVAAPHRFLAGEESALATKVSGGLALPRFTPPRVFEAGVDGAPTLVQNVETLAQVALLARFGPAWFRSAGSAAEPGTMLTTLHTRGGRKVAEAELGTALPALLEDLDSPNPPSAVLVGGYHGAWLPAEVARELRLANADLRPHGAAVGAGVLAALPAEMCGIVETARVVRYLAAESAGQCGPCLNGLPAIANALMELAGTRPSERVVADVQRWSGLVAGRGACHHPDGTIRLVRSALVVFADEVALHQQGHCSARANAAFLPVPNTMPTSDDDWR